MRGPRGEKCAAQGGEMPGHAWPKKRNARPKVAGMRAPAGCTGRTPPTLGRAFLTLGRAWAAHSQFWAAHFFPLRVWPHWVIRFGSCMSGHFLSHAQREGKEEGLLLGHGGPKSPQVVERVRECPDMRDPKSGVERGVNFHRL